jgi:glycosyltransferase involved in cell wall biosynthesis
MISVVIPCYNSQELISRAIISVMNQTVFDQVEKILVIDDASSDGSVDTISQIDCDKIQLIVLPQNSGSAAHPRNIAISSTSSEFIAFLDSDDYWIDNHLELALSKIRNGYDLVSTNASISNFSTKNKKFFPRSFSRRITTMELLFHNPVIMSSVLCKSTIFNHVDISFADSSSKDFYNDYLLWLKLSTLRRLYFYNRETVNYTLSENSDSSLYNSPLQAERETLEIFFSWFKNFASKKCFLYKISYSIFYLIKRLKNLFILTVNAILANR